MTILKLLLVFTVAIPAVAQGSFETFVDSPRKMWGTFSLIDGLFYGNVAVEFGSQGDSVQIFRSTSRDLPGEFQFSLEEKAEFFPTGDPNDPGTTGWVFGVARPLSESELTDLQAGLWWINVNLSPDGTSQLRGQITAVPEPSTLALLALGGSTAWVVSRRRGKKLVPQSDAAWPAEA